MVTWRSLTAEVAQPTTKRENSDFPLRRRYYTVVQRGKRTGRTMAKQEKSRSQTILGYVGANVRRLRVARGWTQEDLADKAGLMWRSVQDLERSAGNPTLKLLLAVAEALRIAPAELFAVAKQEPRPTGRPPSEK